MWKGLSKLMTSLPLQIKFPDKDTFNRSDKIAHSLAKLDTRCIDVTQVYTKEYDGKRPTSAILLSNTQVFILPKNKTKTAQSDTKSKVPQSYGSADKAHVATSPEDPQTGQNN